MFITLFFVQAAWQARSVAQQPLLGADEIMRRMAAFRPKPKEADPFDRLRTESVALRAKLAKLTPEGAADAWLALMRDWETVALSVQSSNSNNASRWEEIMMPALPAPATWPLLRDRLAELPPTEKNRAAIALFDDLLGRDADVLRYLESKRNPDADPQKEDDSSPDHKVSEAEMPIALRVRNLDLLAKIYVRMAYGDPFPFAFDGFPDVVGQFGRERARPLLRQMLEGAWSSFYSFNGTETQDLARAIVLSDLARLKAPQWALARGLADFPFVSAQVAHFGEDILKDGAALNSDADLIFALGLARSGQIDHAVALLSVTSDKYVNLATFVKDRTEEEALFGLVSKLLDRKPIEAVWRLYADLGRTLGRTVEVVERLDGWLSAQELQPESRATCLAWKAELDKESGQPKRAVSEFEEAIGLSSRNIAEEFLGVSKVSGDREALDFVAQTAKGMGTAGSRLDLFDAYVYQGRISEAQDTVLKAAQDVHNVNTSAEGQGRLLDAYPDFGVELAQLYYEENRPAEIITLLHEYPSWGAGDLIGVIDHRRNSNYRSSFQGRPLGFFAAWALAMTGQKPLAVRVLHALVPFDHANDDIFELLNQLDGIGAIGLYDRLIRAGPLDARPLMWKGELLLRLGKLKDAERYVRAAIALDPVDAEAGRERRQFAYHILARILKAQGKASAAGACQRIVKAARIAERAEIEEYAGLYSEAARHYKQALEIYPGDFRAQVGLADSLRLIGRQSEALVAYGKALQLLPTSQGPVGELNLYFRAGKERELARSALSALRQAHPRDPGILFAEGQFHAQVGDDKAAVASFEAAVKRDPRYLRAWKNIALVGSKGAATRAQVKEAVLSIISLDPLGWNNYYLSAGLGLFGDKSALWRTYNQAFRTVLPFPTSSLYSLEASKRSLASGTRPVQARSGLALYGGPGAALGELEELRKLFP